MRWRYKNRTFEFGRGSDRIEQLMCDDITGQKLYFAKSKVQVRIVAVPSSTAQMRPSSGCCGCIGL